MDHRGFISLRQKHQKTQRQMSEFLGASLKAIQSFEQGWRKVPVPIERQTLFLIYTKQGTAKEYRPCWDIRNCPPEIRETSPAGGCVLTDKVIASGVHDLISHVPDKDKVDLHQGNLFLASPFLGIMRMDSFFKKVPMMKVSCWLQGTQNGAKGCTDGCKG